MSTNRRRLEREEARAREARDRARAEAERVARDEAVRVIEMWNQALAAGGRVWFSPTIRAAAVTGYRWLTVYCPGCGTVSDVDLAKLDRHPDSSIMSLIPELSCRTCRPHAPFAQLKRLSREKPTSSSSGSNLA